MRNNLTFKKTKAVTLLEMLISIFIFALVSASVSLVFNRSLFVYRASTDKNIAAQEAQTAIEWLVRDIQTACTIVVAQTDNIALINPQQQYIRYYLDPINKTIQRQECADQSYLLAENVTQFSLKYYDINNNIIADPVTNILSLKTVEIDITTSRNRQEFRLNTVAKFDYNPEYFWVKTYGGSGADVIFGIQQDEDGGYILGGTTQSFGAGDLDFLIIKTDASGSIQWAKTYGGAGLDNFRAIQKAGDGGYIFLGWTASFGNNYQYLVVKTDGSGNIGAAYPGTWAKTYGGKFWEYPTYLQRTKDDGYIIGGMSNSFIGSPGGCQYDLLVIKTDSSGNIVWSKTYGVNDDNLYCLRQTQDEGYVLFGQKRSSCGATDGDFLLIKTGSDGGVEWARVYSGSNDDLGITIQQTDDDGDGLIDDGYILGGRTTSFGAGLNDILLIKTNANGDAGASYTGTWAKTYGGSDHEGLDYTLQQTSDGGYILGGWTYTPSFGVSSQDILMIKTDANGNVGVAYPGTWAKPYGGAGIDEALDLQKTLDGGYILGGVSPSFTESDDFLVIKTNSLGELGCCGISRPAVTGSLSVQSQTLTRMEYPDTNGNPGDNITVQVKTYNPAPPPPPVGQEQDATYFTFQPKTHGMDFTLIVQEYPNSNGYPDFSAAPTTTTVCPSPPAAEP